MPAARIIVNLWKRNVLRLPKFPSLPLDRKSLVKRIKESKALKTRFQIVVEDKQLLASRQLVLSN